MFLVRASNGSHYALKRISVNNQKDLAVGKLEISIMVSDKDVNVKFETKSFRLQFFRSLLT